MNLSLHQHGFVRGRSTATNLYNFNNYISNALDNHLETDVYTDFSKIFDQVAHRVLLNKLLNFGNHMLIHHTVISHII